MGRVLAIVENGYRGGPEVQYADPLYVIRGLHQQFDAVDVALRGTAVTYALAAGERPSLRIGSRLLETMPDHPSSLRALLEAGAEVFVDPEDLRRHGLAPERLADGVTCRETATLTRDWTDYKGVWFL